MSGRSAVFNILATSRNLAADDLLLAALPGLEPDVQLDALDVLVARQQAEPLRQLVGRYDALPENCRDRLAGWVDRLESFLREMVRSPSENVRLNSIELLAASRSEATAYLLSLALTGGTSKTRGKAAAALRTLSRALADQLDHSAWHVGLLGQEQRCYSQFCRLVERRGLLVSALGEALKSYSSHLRTSVIEAAACFTEQLESEFAAHCRDGKSKCWRVIVDTWRTAPEPVWAPLALMTLGQEQGRSDAARAIADCTATPFMAALFNHSWLLRDSRIQAGCRKIRRLSWLEHSSAPLLNLSGTEFIKAIRFLRCTSIPQEQLLQWSKEVVLSGHPDKQRVALFAIMSVDSDAATEVLEVVVDWASRDLAAVALRELQRRKLVQETSLPGRYPLREQGSTGDSVTGVERFASFDEVWERYDEVDAGDREAALVRVRLTDANFISAVAQRLSSVAAKDRLRALQVIRSLRLVQPFKEQILECARDSDRFVRSAAVRLLGDIGDSASQMMMRSAMKDADRRVRANAIEALEESDTLRHPDDVSAALQDADHRVRATAVRALLKMRTPEAARSLLEMLQHSSIAHRAAALWVVEKHGLARVVAQVKTIADTDPDEQVRRRARRLLRLQRRRRRYVPIPGPLEEDQR